MNAKSQLDVHPDAERLSAFAEQALPDGEREEILGHLSGCGRCREVVFLAAEAAGATAAVRSAARHDSWFRNWRVVWIPAAALGAVVGVAIFVQLRRVEIAAEQAKAAHEAQEQAMETASTAPTPTEMHAAPRAVAAHAPAEPKKQKPRLPTSAYTDSKELAAVTAPPPAGDVSAMEKAGSDETAQAQGASSSGYRAMGSAIELKPVPAMTARREELGRAATAYQVNEVAANAMAPPSAGGLAKRESTGALAPAAQFNRNPSPPESLKAGERHGLAGAFAMNRARLVELPSGLAAVMTAKTQHSMLAVDGAGAVFVREDAGIQWESVQKQWSGRAVTVRVQRLAEGKESGDAASAGAVFEIVNDQGLVWVSTDGRMWKAK